MDFAERSYASRHAGKPRLAAHANGTTLPEGFISWLRTKGIESLTISQNREQAVNSRCAGSDSLTHEHYISKLHPACAKTTFLFPCAERSVFKRNSSRGAVPLTGLNINVANNLFTRCRCFSDAASSSSISSASSSAGPRMKVTGDAE